MTTITLYHGTSSDVLETVREQGFLRRPYLTDDLNLADYYAECAVDEDGSEEIILQVTISTDDLVGDQSALEEPVQRNLATVQSQMDQFSDLSHWKATLTMVGSVRSTVDVSVEDIAVIHPQGTKTR